MNTRQSQTQDLSRITASLRPFLLSALCLPTFLTLAATLAQTPAGVSPDLPAMIRSKDPQQQAQAVALMRAQIDRDGAKVEWEPVIACAGVMRSEKMQAQAIELLDRATPFLLSRGDRGSAMLLAYKAAILSDQGKDMEAVAALDQARPIQLDDFVWCLEAWGLDDVLVRSGRLTQTLEVIDQASIGHVTQVWRLEMDLKLKAQMLLSGGKPLEALACAKSLYNISSMKGTADALGMLSRCLKAAYPGNRQLLEKFRDEQSAGANPSAATQPTALKSTVLANIKVNGTAYGKALGASMFPSTIEEDFDKLTRGGNLLLLADRPQEAQVWFEQAYRVCSDDQLPAASESLARVMKAQDGTIGRANAWLLSIRPEKAPGR